MKTALYILFVFANNFYCCSGISSLTFTREGEALYHHSSSELQRISLAVHRVTTTRCYLNLPRKEVEDGDTGEIENSEVKGDQDTTPIVNGNLDSKESSVIEKVYLNYFLVTILISIIFY